MEIIKVKLSEIKPYKNNAKEHPQEQIEQIKKSIQEFGNNDPIAIDEDNTIIEGHGRFYALQQLGYDEAECIRLTHLSEEQKKAYILVHNKLTMNSDFDEKILEKELDDILNIDMDDYGFIKDIEEDVKEDVEEPDIKFTEILGEEHNYIVLYFDNEVDWLQAESLFDIQPVQCPSTRKDGKITNSMKRIGVGRVIKGREAIEKIRREYENIS